MSMLIATNPPRHEALRRTSRSAYELYVPGAALRASWYGSCKVVAEWVFALAILLTAFQAIEQRAQGDAPLWLNLTLAATIMGTFTALLLRFGLLSAVVGLTVANMLLVFHLSTDFSSWRSGPTVDVLIVLVVLVGLAFRASQRRVRSAVVAAS